MDWYFSLVNMIWYHMMAEIFHDWTSMLALVSIPYQSKVAQSVSLNSMGPRDAYVRR